MLIKRLKDCPEFVAGDSSVLKELLHPDKAGVKLNYSLAYARLAAGCATKLHCLKTSEVYYILQGMGRMHIDGEQENVSSGDAVYIPPGSRQFIANTGAVELIFLCIVEPAWQKQDEEVF